MLGWEPGASLHCAPGYVGLPLWGWECGVVALCLGLMLVCPLGPCFTVPWAALVWPFGVEIPFWSYHLYGTQATIFAQAGSLTL